MNVPDWYALVLLGLAAYRTWRLLAEDDLTDRARRYVTRLGPSWQKEGDPIPDGYRLKAMQFILCPWCLGFWVAAGWWGLWQQWGHGTLVAAALAALSLFPPLLERLVSSD